MGSGLANPRPSSWSTRQGASSSTCVEVAMPVWLECQQCHSSFTRSPSVVKKRAVKYCSHACYHASRGSVSCLCARCGSAFTVNAFRASNGTMKYCSRSCHYNSPPPQQCLICGTRFHLKRSAVAKGAGIYCSLDCVGISMRADPTRLAERNRTPYMLPRKAWHILKAFYHHRCVYCGKKPKRLSQDHLTPISKGGQGTVHNIVPACISCNSRKRHGPVLCPVQPLLLLPC